ncbi:MAG: 3-phosphoshikimate 1-carboxyvinyltransferase [Nitrospiraceae bacterium]|nr:MAG: 3-phosphoshikimate 1-carboxyvinyltransferase [Nitrospiraceae bacterium]
MNSAKPKRPGRSLSEIRIRYSTPLRGEIIPPPDKSISHRAVILSSLAEGTSVIRNFLFAEDPVSTVNAFRQMGAEIKIEGQGTRGRGQETKIIINGKGLSGLSAPEAEIDCGNSGTTMRLLCGVLSGQPFSATLKGDASLTRRPMKRVMEPLSLMGAAFKSENGYPPLTVTGGYLQPIHYQSPVASAQVKSSVLLAGLYCDGVTSVTEPERSRDHTERMLKAAGAHLAVDNLTVSVKGRATLKPSDIIVPNDFSSAAFFMTAGILVPGSEILIKNVGINPTRTGLLEILRSMGAEISLENEREVSGEPVADIHVRHTPLKGIEVSGDMVPKTIDEFPILCVAAALAQGHTKITGAKELRVKESDRITTMSNALKKMGISVEELEDGLIIEGRERLKPATIQSCGDHRIAMSMAIAGLRADGETTVLDTDCIKTSFPGFMELLETLQK